MSQHDYNIVCTIVFVQNDDYSIVCTSIVFVQNSGHHLIVVNGDVAFDEVNEFLKDSGDIMPSSAVNSTRFYGKTFEKQANCTLFSIMWALKENLPFSEGDKFTNLNFYSSSLSVEEATAITGGDRC